MLKLLNYLVLSKIHIVGMIAHLYISRTSTFVEQTHPSY